jgi:hypothetical protein
MGATRVYWTHRQRHSVRPFGAPLWSQQPHCGGCWSAGWAITWNAVSGLHGGVGDRCYLPPSVLTTALRMRRNLCLPNRTTPGLAFYVRRLLIPLPTPHFTLQPSSVHKFAKPAYRFLGRLSLPQHDLYHNSFSCTQPPVVTFSQYTRNDEGAIHPTLLLKRIEDGSFGLCEECSVKIPASRLEAIPYSALCVQCASQREEGRGP